MRAVSITKSGKTTIVEIKNVGQTKNEVFALNELTNVYTVGETLVIPVSTDKRITVAYVEIENKLSSTDLKDYLIKASAIFLFNQ